MLTEDWSNDAENSALHFKILIFNNIFHPNKFRFGKHKRLLLKITKQNC